MDIYSFINSGDVAAYCREIKKVWSPFEMAVIIGRSFRPMADKHEALRQLTADIPDMAMPENTYCGSSATLHEKIKDYIIYKERVFELLKTPEQGAIYKHKVRWYGEDRYSDGVFSSFERVLDDARINWTRDEAFEFTIYKSFIDDQMNEKGSIEATLDYDGNLFSINTYGYSVEMFPGIDAEGVFDFEDWFFVDIPVPFKRGDLLTYSQHKGSAARARRVFVLDWLDREDHRIFESNLESGEGCELEGSGYFADDSGLLYLDHAISYDHFEYYRGKLFSNERILHYVSLFLQGEDKNNRRRSIDLPELLTMQCRIVLENRFYSEVGFTNHGCYISENLLAENRLSREEEDQVRQGKALAPWLVGKLTLEQVKFLAEETGADMESVQLGLCDDGGWYMGRCAKTVYRENHYERVGDGNFDPNKRVIAKSILESYGETEAGWVDNYQDPDYKDDGFPPMPDYTN